MTSAATPMCSAIEQATPQCHSDQLPVRKDIAPRNPERAEAKSSVRVSEPSSCSKGEPVGGKQTVLMSKPSALSSYEKAHANSGTTPRLIGGHYQGKHRGMRTQRPMAISTLNYRAHQPCFKLVGETMLEMKMMLVPGIKLSQINSYSCLPVFCGPGNVRKDRPYVMMEHFGHHLGPK